MGMRAPRRAVSTAAAVLLVALPATAAPSVGQGVARQGQPSVPSVVPAGPLVEAAPATPAPVPPAPAPSTTPTTPGAVAAGAPVAAAFAGEVVDGIPAAALRAYQTAAATVAIKDPTCGLDWALLAGIGRVESDHGRYGGSVLDGAGVARPAILGPVLSGGPGMARISDSDGGRLDGDVAFDRAVGPMQFIPATWALAGADGDGDGLANPQDLDDAALAAARYLCAGTGSVATPEGARAALLRYNHSTEYGMRVLWLASAYRSGTSVAEPPALTAPQPTGAVPPYVAAVGSTAEDPGTPADSPQTIAAAAPHSSSRPASATVVETTSSRPTTTSTSTSTSTTTASPSTTTATSPSTTTTEPPSTTTTTSPSTTTTTSPSTTTTTEPPSTTTSPSSTTTTEPSSSTTTTTTSPSTTTTTEPPSTTTTTAPPST